MGDGSRKSIDLKLSTLPDSPGVYLFKDSRGKVLYVGKAQCLTDRVRSYFADRLEDPKTLLLRRRIADVETIVTHSNVEALILEANLIKQHQPRYNIRLKDDKKFPYVRITMEEQYPRVFPTRTLPRRLSGKGGDSLFFGPYTNVKALRETLKLLRTIFPLRSCKQKIPSSRARACLNYHLRRCQAPCEGRITPEQYHEVLQGVIRFLSGRRHELADTLAERMRAAGDAQDFETASRLRDQLKAVESTMTSQRVVFADNRSRDVIALAREGNLSSAAVLHIREGKLIGRQRFFLKNPQEAREGEVLASFLKQYYLTGAYVPEEIVLPARPGVATARLEEEELLRQWLKERQEKIRFLTPQRGPARELVSLAQKNARAGLEEELQRVGERKGKVSPAVQELQRILALPRPPVHIQAVDISNIGGAEPVGSLVVFDNGAPRKSQYRKFRIRTVTGQDDFAMMSEVVKRRFNRLLKEKAALPDLLLVDGGRGQLNAALAVLRDLGLENQPVVGLAKRLDEVYLPQAKETVMIPRQAGALHLLQRVRDEAHRFAVSFHRASRERTLRRSVLDQIPGIGEKRKEVLLTRFGSAEEIRRASVEQIGSTPGISPQLARVVFQFLHQGGPKNAESNSTHS